MLVLALLPLLTFGLTVAVARRAGLLGREAVLVAAVAWGAFLAVSTEVLSRLDALTPLALLTVWGLAAALLVVVGHRHVGWGRPDKPRGDIFGFVVIGGVAVLAVLELLVALVAAPGTWDSMTYHLPRVEHWRQQGNVDFYPTSVDRQLYSAPWSEYTVAHLRILAGSDRLSNVVQWLAGVLTTVAVSLIAQRLGGGKRAQVLAAVVAATAPMAILQATSTQTDYSVSLWITVSVWAILRDLQQRDAAGAVLLGVAVGLAILTKGTAIIILAPAGLMWLVLRLRGAPAREAVSAVAVVLLAGVINVGHWERNYDYFGSPLGPASASALVRNDAHGLGVVVSNLIRDGAMNLASTFTPAGRVVNGSVRAVHDLLGLDVNDPVTTFPGTRFAVRPSRDEDRVGNPLHMVLAVIAAGLLLASRRMRTAPLVLYVLGLFLATVLFAWQLRWQPWITRLELPLFMLAAPMIGLVIARLRSSGQALIAIALIFPAALLLLGNDNRAMLGEGSVFTATRTEQTFRLRPELRVPYLAAVEVVRESEAGRVGVVLGSDDWEYPLWRGLRGIYIQSARSADYPSGRVPDFDAVVCVSVSSDCAPRAGWSVVDANGVIVLVKNR